MSTPLTVNLSLFIFQNYEKISSSNGFKSLTNYLLENDEVKNLYTPYEVLRSIPLTFIKKNIIHDVTFITDFNEARFDNIYQNFEKYLYTKTVPYRSFVICPHFQIETEKLTLNDTLRIRILSESEFEEFFNIFQFNFFHSPNDFIHPKSVILEKVFEVKKNPKVVMNSPTREQTEQTKNIFIKLVTALRLFKKGRVGFNTIFRQNLSDWEGGGLGSGSSPAFPHSIGGSFQLLESENENFIKFGHFFKALNFKELDKNFRIATNRFNSAYERKDPEDRLIDYVIALTSLFSRKDESGLGRYRLSMRVALLLEHNSEKRKNVRKEIVEIYDKRSAIVHGSDVKKFQNFENLGDLVDKAEDYVRRSLQVLLRLDSRVGGRRKVIENIENGLFSATIDFDINFGDDSNP